MMAVIMEFDRIIVKVERSQRLHIGDAKIRADVFPVLVAPAAAGDILPRRGGQLRKGLVWLTAQDHFAAGFAQCGSRRRRWMRTDGHMGPASAESTEPLLRDSQLWRRTTPEQIRRRSRDYQEIGIEIANPGSNVDGAEILNLGVDEQCLSARLLYLLISKK